MKEHDAGCAPQWTNHVCFDKVGFCRLYDVHVALGFVSTGPLPPFLSLALVARVSALRAMGELRAKTPATRSILVVLLNGL